MTANNLRTFPVAPGQPQPASVPYAIFDHVRNERDRLRDELADLRAQQPHDTATPDERERGEALLARAIDFVHYDDPEAVRAESWRRAFHALPVAVLYAYSLGHADAHNTMLPAPDVDPPARVFWTPGRVALVMAVLAILAIVLVGR